MSRRSLAALQFLLLGPAIVFMTAVVIRYLPLVRQPAQNVVMAYAHRGWTLWLLLIALPLVVLVTGGATLLRTRNGAVAAATIVACGILAVVAVHMAMN